MVLRRQYTIAGEMMRDVQFPGGDDARNYCECGVVSFVMPPNSLRDDNFPHRTNDGIPCPKAEILVQAKRAEEGRTVAELDRLDRGAAAYASVARRGGGARGRPAP